MNFYPDTKFIYLLVNMGIYCMFCVACSNDNGSTDNALNAPPKAVAGASPVKGILPLDVSFKGSNSSDDNGIAKYQWDFQDGSFSDKSMVVHTFDIPGTYAVELSVEDDQGLTSIDIVDIEVNPPANEAPVARMVASTISGYAPLVVSLNAVSSSDDKGIETVLWNFPNNITSAEPITTITFDNVGIYDIMLTVSDAEGLQDTTSISIIVSEKCETDGGKANERGLKTWCWNDINVAPGGPDSFMFSNDELNVNAECTANQITNEGSNLMFLVNPTSPVPSSWCNNNYNFRAEISTAPWRVDHPEGTEEWFGWSYTFGEKYIIDKDNYWYFFQVHNGVAGNSPLIFMQIIGGNVPNAEDGQIRIGSAVGNSNDSVNTGVFPEAGQKLDIVVHVIWGDGENGLLEVWINDKLYFSKQKVRTVMISNPVGGNAKWGIYKPNWRTSSGVESSRNLGVSNMEMVMGTLRVITRLPTDNNYGKDSYDEVAPKW